MKQISVQNKYISTLLNQSTVAVRFINKHTKGGKS